MDTETTKYMLRIFFMSSRVCDESEIIVRNKQNAYFAAVGAGSCNAPAGFSEYMQACLAAAINPVNKSGQDTERRNPEDENAVIQNAGALQLLRGGGSEAHDALRQKEIHRQLRM